jgi:hypothetical protein
MQNSFSRLITLIATLGASTALSAAAPYSAGIRNQPSGLTSNTFFGAAIAVGERGAGLAGSFNGTVHAFAPGPSGALVFVQQLTSGVSGDLFGGSVGLSTSLVPGNFAAVGAFGDDVAFANAGKVYMYRTQLSLATPFLAAGELVSPNPTAAGNFGYSVAVQGNFVFVGEVKAKNALGDVVGAVHIFENTGASTWALRTSLFGTQLDGSQGKRFGHAVAVSGDSLVIGAPKENDEALTTNGAVYVYTGAGASWTLEQRLLAVDRASDDELGSSVDIDGDCLITGSLRDDKAAGVDAGSAYIFERVSAWSQRAKLVSSGATQFNIFGTSVAISGDEAIVGAYCETNAVNPCIGAGSAEVFQRTASGTWAGVQRITAPDGANGEGFGASVAFAPGNRSAVVGAFRASAPSNAGALYLLSGDQLFSDGFE